MPQSNGLANVMGCGCAGASFGTVSNCGNEKDATLQSFPIAEHSRPEFLVRGTKMLHVGLVKILVGRADVDGTPGCHLIDGKGVSGAKERVLQLGIELMVPNKALPHRFHGIGKHILCWLVHHQQGNEAF